MSSSSEATAAPAEITEAPFIPSPGRAIEFDARTFLRDKIVEVRGENVAVHVEGAILGPNDTLKVECMADLNAFDALTRAGVNVAGYRYKRPFERFTATLSVDEISAATAVSSLAAVGNDSGEGSEEFLAEMDPEATRG